MKVRVIPLGQLVISAFRSHRSKGGTRTLSNNTAPSVIDKILVNHIRHNLMDFPKITYTNDLEYMEHWKERQLAIAKAYPCLAHEIERQIQAKEILVTDSLL